MHPVSASSRCRIILKVSSSWNSTRTSQVLAADPDPRPSRLQGAQLHVPRAPRGISNPRLPAQCPFGEKVKVKVVSDSLRPHGLYSPWDSPGQNTGVGSLSLLQGIFPTQGSKPRSPTLQADSSPAEPPAKPDLELILGHPCYYHSFTQKSPFDLLPTELRPDSAFGSPRPPLLLVNDTLRPQCRFELSINIA